jgi:hypothetical protein
MAALTRAQIGEKALQKVGNLARGETANVDDLVIATDALGRLISSLVVHGYTWPTVPLATDTGLGEHWDEALILGTAAEIGDEFGADLTTTAMRLQQWAGLRSKLIDYDAPALPDCISVDEFRRPYSPLDL